MSRGNAPLRFPLHGLSQSPGMVHSDLPQLLAVYAYNRAT